MIDSPQKTSGALKLKEEMAIPLSFAPVIWAICTFRVSGTVPWSAAHPRRGGLLHNKATKAALCSVEVAEMLMPLITGPPSAERYEVSVPVQTNVKAKLCYENRSFAGQFRRWPSPVSWASSD